MITLRRFRCDQRAACCAPRADGRPCLPLDHARSTTQTARSSQAGIGSLPQQQRRASVCGSAAALRSGCDALNASLHPPLHIPRSPTADRSRKIRIRGKVMNAPISNWPVSDFPITDRKIAGHSACRRVNAMKPPLIVWQRRSRQGSTGRSLRRSRFRSSLTRRRRRGVLLLGFHRGKSVCPIEDLTDLLQFRAVISSQFCVKWDYC